MIGYKGSSALITPREDIGLGFDEIDVESIRAGYVGFQIAPLIEANYKSGQYRTMKLNQLLQKRDASRNPDGSFKRIDADFEMKTYRCKDYGLEMPVDNSRAAEFAGIIDSEQVAASLARHGVLEAHELRVIAVIDAITPTAVGSGHKFDDDTAPLTADFAGYKQTFREACGFAPNALCLDQSVIDLMMENASIQDKFVGANNRTAREIMLTGLAAALGLEEVIAANGMQNTVASPKAASLATTWPRAKALLFRKSMAPNTETPQFMRTIHWSGAGSRPGCSFEQYEEPQTDSTVIRQRMDTTEDVIYSGCAMVLSTILSS